MYSNLNYIAAIYPFSSGLSESQEENETSLSLEEFLHTLAHLKATPPPMSLFKRQDINGNELSMDEFLDVLVHQKQPVQTLSDSTSAPLLEDTNEQQEMYEYPSDGTRTKRIHRHVLAKDQTPETTEFSKPENREVVRDTKHGFSKEQIDKCEVNVYDIIYCISVVSILFWYLYMTNVFNALSDKVGWFWKDSITAIPKISEDSTTKV